MGAAISTRVADPLRWTLRTLDMLAIVALVSLYAYGVLMILFREPKDWVDLIWDDAYYYLGVVRGIVENGSSSFLPPFETNGYQPLWLLLLSGSAFVFGTSDRSLAVQLYTLCHAFVAAFAWMSRRKFGVAFPAIASAAVFYSASLQGMETAMIPALVLAFFYGRSWLGKGVASSLIFLTRLDALALVVAKDLYSFVSRRETNLSHYLVLAPVVAGYFAVNQFLFGVAVPVSGLAKAVGSVPGENLVVIYQHADALAVPVVLLASALACSLIATGRADVGFKDEICILLASLCVLCAYYTLFSGWRLWGWYFWPQMMIFYYVILSGVFALIDGQAAASADPARYYLPATAMLALFSYALLPAARYSLSVLHHGPFAVDNGSGSFGEKNVELAGLVRSSRLRKGTFFAMGDRAGSFGFFLGGRYRFLQTEGLVGPYSYYESMKKGEGAQFLASHGVDYLIAERDRFLEEGGLIGVVEPVQPLSSRFGQYLVCFRKSDVLIDQSYFANSIYSRRYVFDFSKRTACPAAMVSEFEALRRSYGRLRQFTLYSEYKPRTSWLARLLAELVPVQYAP